MIWSSDRAGYRSHGSWGAERDIYIMFFDGEAYDKFRLSKEETSLSIGAVMVSEKAKALEMAAKSGDTDYIRLHHHAVMKEYILLMDRLREIIIE